MKVWQAAGVAAALAGSVSAFWRMECRYQTGYGRLDPIVDYGDVSSHVHAFAGSNGKPHPLTPAAALFCSPTI